MDKQQLKQTIDDNITTNGQNEITGEKLNDVLNDMVDSLGVVNQISVGTTTTGVAGTDASVTNSGTATAPVLNFTIPRGSDGQDGADAVNSFKGWWPDLATLKASYTAIAGDSAYVKDASPATTWSIYVYDSTASSDNYWADSGTDADTSNVQTFASGEEVNEVGIDDTHLSNPTQCSIPLALDVVGKLNQVGVTASAKDLIIALFRKCAFITDDAGDDIDDLEEEFAGQRILMSITATMPQSYEVHEGDDLNVLRNYLTVTANYDDGSSNTVSTYTLSGTLTEGTSVITVSYSGMTTQVSVTVLALIISFESNEFAKGVNLGNIYTGQGTTYNYCIDSPTRMCSPQFGKLIKGGTYRINIDCNYSTVNLDIQAYTEAAATKVSNHQNLTSTGGGGTIDIWDSSYIQFTDGVAQVTIPEYSIQNEPTAKIIGLRVVFKQNSAGTSMSSDFAVTSLTFTKI